MKVPEEFYSIGYLLLCLSVFLWTILTGNAVPMDTIVKDTDRLLRYLDRV